MNARLFTLLFVLCSYALNAVNLPFYHLSAANFDDDFDAIDEEHLVAFHTTNQGIGIDSVESYLRSLLGESVPKHNLPNPTMCVEQKSKD